MPLRFGTGELYGLNFARLTPGQIRAMASASHRAYECPFRSSESSTIRPKCSKKGGVCSIRQYSNDGGKVTAVDDPVTTCPNRFLEDGLIMRWVGEKLLGTSSPSIVSELPFLMSETRNDVESIDAVGKIDKVLVNPVGHALCWCALEMQAVYFSGMSMENDFKVMRQWSGPGIPFPEVQRRPDFRSSGPKRLMPQLQIKVPTISRWGKKMAVVVDRAFWESLGTMREVRDVSNCEIVWFVVSYAEAPSGRFSLVRHQIHYTTLSHAVEGLTGGTPMSLDCFERVIRDRLSRV